MLRDCASTTVTVPAARLVTNAYRASSSKTMSCGPAPTGTLPAIRSEAVSMTVSFEPSTADGSHATQAVRPSGAIATRTGLGPTAISAATDQVDVAMTATRSAAGRATK